MLLKIFRAASSTALVFLFALTIALAEFLYSPLRIPPGMSYFEVEKGSHIQNLALEFERRGFISSAILFRLSYSLFLTGQTVKAGEYEFPSSITVKESLFTMFKGKIRLVSVTTPEGLTGREIQKLLESDYQFQANGFSAAFLKADLVSELDTSAEDLEGYLFPETYLLPRKADGFELVSAMTGQFLKAFDASLRARARELRMSVREAVTLASLIEKETGCEEERPLVSAVFHNRLRLGMKLDCDPTVIYALERAGRYRGSLFLKDLSFPSPYNTYLNPGLPPGPICNPGLSSIRAALYPAADDYLYFVSRGDGTHQFSSTYADHLAAIRKYRLK